MAWLRHREFCLEKAEEYSRSQGMVYVALAGLSMSPEELDAEEAKWRAEDQKRDKLYSTLEQAYRHAVWRPWERIWIDDVLPEE